MCIKVFLLIYNNFFSTDEFIKIFNILFWDFHSSQKLFLRRKYLTTNITSALITSHLMIFLYFFLLLYLEFKIVHRWWRRHLAALVSIIIIITLTMHIMMRLKEWVCWEIEIDLKPFLLAILFFSQCFVLARIKCFFVGYWISLAEKMKQWNSICLHLLIYQRFLATQITIFELEKYFQKYFVNLKFLIIKNKKNLS